METFLNKDTKVVNLYKEQYDIYIGRSGKGKSSIWGNPYSAKEHGHDKCISLFKDYIYKKLVSDKILQEELSKLKGMKLGCFCKPKACHGDVLIEMMELFCPDED